MLRHIQGEHDDNGGHPTPAGCHALPGGEHRAHPGEEEQNATKPNKKSATL